jgi:hypothetical protein
VLAGSPHFPGTGRSYPYSQSHTPASVSPSHVPPCLPLTQWFLALEGLKISGELKTDTFGTLSQTNEISGWLDPKNGAPKPVMVALACNPTTREADAEGCELEASLGYIVKPCLKKQKQPPLQKTVFYRLSILHNNPTSRYTPQRTEIS